MDIKNKIITKANDLGFQKIGFTDAKFHKNDHDKLYSWIDNNYHAGMEWINTRKEERGNILKYFPEAKTVISFAYNYYSGKGSKDISNEYKFSNYAWGDDYHVVLKKYLFEIVSYMKSIWNDFNYRVCVDTSPLMEKLWAKRAGLGWIGKHTNLINPKIGSWFFLCEILLDIELEYDNEFE